MELTWRYVYLTFLDSRDIDMDTDFAFYQVNLYGAQSFSKIAEQQKSIGIPSPKLKADWKHVLIWTTRHFQETGSIEKDGHCMGLHAWEA